jgi:hypothetical protein
MSVELELEEDGKLRLRVHKEKERDLSEIVDPIDLIYEICTAANISCLVGVGELTILLPDGVKIEPKEGESA